MTPGHLIYWQEVDSARRLRWMSGMPGLLLSCETRSVRVPLTALTSMELQPQAHVEIEVTFPEPVDIPVAELQDKTGTGGSRRTRVRHVVGAAEATDTSAAAVQSLEKLLVEAARLGHHDVCFVLVQVAI